MDSQSPKLLVANRGEIAIRICRSAFELGWRTVALYTENDTSHASYADEAVLLESPGRYMDPEHIAEIALRTDCTHVHPGYGFLSESPKLASLFHSSAAGGLCAPSPSSAEHVILVGPSIEVLEITSDKVRSRELATSLGVPVAPGSRVSSAEDVRTFTQKNGFPVVIKALDGGGGRGIRLVHTADEVEDAFRRCVGESTSRLVFVEKAFVGPGWRHVEVQIVGDGTGEVTHLWERECSVQRRFQKVVEMAPSTLPRDAAEPLIQAALKMAHHLRYAGLGTFEFLVNGQSHEWIFLEINPRIQVEHTVTEEIMNVDLVRVQVLLSQPGARLASVLPMHIPTPPPPQGHAIQLRLVAEDPQNAFQLSTGTIHPADVSWSAGRGVRIDTWLSAGPHGGSHHEPQWTVGVDFDSLLAKIVVHGETFQGSTTRALRALRETYVRGDVKTNMQLLAGVMAHPDWTAGAVHTRWLESRVDEVLLLGRQHISRQDQASRTSTFTGQSDRLPSQSDNAPGTVLLQPGASFQLSLSSATQTPSDEPAQNHTVVLSSLGHNAFPSQLSGTLTTSLTSVPLSFSLTQLSATSTSAHIELANPRDPTHVASPLSGKVVELHPALTAAVEGLETGRYVRKGEAVVVVTVMKMESVVTAPVSGNVVRLGRGVEVGAIVGEGTLLCVLDLGEGPGSGGLARL